MELNDLQAQRAAKLEQLRAAGLDPYPPRCRRSHTIGQVLAAFDELAAGEAVVTLAGRIIGARRVMGKIAFAHIEDGTGEIQLWLSRADLGDEWFERFRDQIDTFDIVQATGTLRRTKTGERSLFVREMAVLAKAINPPPEKWAGLQDVEERHRQRYLDLIVNRERRDIFRARAQVISTMRRVLDDRGFLEVETPVLQPIYGGAAARPFITYHNALGQNLYLRIATELYLKRLIVGGFPGVYEIGKNFRNEGVDRSHNPEFTMMECYQAYADYHAMMTLVEEMVGEICLAVHGTTTVSYQGRELDVRPPWPRIAMADAIVEHTGIDITRHTDLDSLHAAIADRGLRVDRKTSWAKQVDELFSEFVQPHLFRPTFIIDYPVAMSPLAKRIPGRPDFAERFEAFIAGMEIGNAFTELNDPFDQEERFREQLRAFAAGDEEAHQMDEDFINALRYGMPPTGGLGIGIDRLVMVLTDQASIREVILFPHLRERLEGRG
ncbi:MAG: lysine--tRNA ligase [Chloroflexus aggregans]|uniref:Lysine--tRNA ligase n=1 Tax=Chloroflexus aggregans TaxID=152260 RepID=A0A2J6X9Z3_9CHLR|nr:MAG: lysine--tRNA ligase [Chloroflexus aggregans]